MLPAMKSITMWIHGSRTCIFVYGGYDQPVLRLIDGTVLVREEIITPGAAVGRSEIWALECDIWNGDVLLMAACEPAAATIAAGAAR
jgi:hypothetical protein